MLLNRKDIISHVDDVITLFDVDVTPPDDVTVNF